MRRMFQLMVFALLAAMAAPVFAQETEPDPQVQAAKEETAVVYDLGRFFGYVWRLQEEYADLALDRAQMTQLYDVMTAVESMTRVEPDWAEDQLDFLELDLLEPAQLMQVDMFALAREESREASSGTGTGPGASGQTGTGSGPILSYVNGGAFNPIVDETKTTGQDFAALLDFLRGELGR